MIDVTRYKAKAVQGLYAFNHFEAEDGSFVQVHVHGSPVVFRDTEGEFREFPSLDSFLEWAKEEER